MFCYSSLAVKSSLSKSRYTYSAFRLDGFSCNVSFFAIHILAGEKPYLQYIFNLSNISFSIMIGDKNNDKSQQ